MIPGFESIAESWLAWVASATWQLALLVCVVAAVAWAVRRASPRLRYALWLLVLLKVFLPPSLAVGWGVGRWGLRPLWHSMQPTVANMRFDAPISSAAGNTAVGQEIAAKNGVASAQYFPAAGLPSATLLFVIWSAGCALFVGFVLWHYRRLVISTRKMQQIDEGPLRVQLESIALRMGEKRIPELFISTKATSPFLFGLARPSIVLPRQVVERLSEADIHGVLLHELNHWRRRDPWIGWLQVLTQGLFWFHPLVWYANARLRQERESVCDEAVLRAGVCEPFSYGEAILGVLVAARGRSLVQGSLVGVFEPGANIQKRLEEIMNFQPGKREFGFWSRAAVAAFALLFLPMAVPGLRATEVEVAVDAGDKDESAAAHTDASKTPKGPPRIVESSPSPGDTNVDPALTEITVTFDRDMRGGMSWTGGGPEFPEIDPKREPHWLDQRTCVLPVKLSKAKFYRVGINATSHQNFKSEQGTVAPCSAIYFTTRGASKKVERQLRRPKIVKLVPQNGATDVDPDLKAIRVTFNMPMGKGFSWTGGGPRFPTVPEGKGPHWTNEGRTCVLPVSLKPDWQYELGLNSLSHINFSSQWGVPLEPVEYRFKTRPVGK